MAASTTHRRRLSADAALTTSIEAQAPDHSLNKSVWDCGSSLYDSFELYTFSQQLGRAMGGGSSSATIIEDGRLRSQSMPHFVSNRSGGTSEFHYAPIPEEDEVINFEMQRPHPKSNSRLRMGIPRVVQRFFTRAFFLKSKADKPKQDPDREDAEQKRYPGHAFLSHNKWRARSASKYRNTHL